MAEINIKKKTVDTNEMEKNAKKAFLPNEEKIAKAKEKAYTEKNFPQIRKPLIEVMCEMQAEKEPSEKDKLEAQVTKTLLVKKIIEDDGSVNQDVLEFLKDKPEDAHVKIITPDGTAIVATPEQIKMMLDMTPCDVYQDSIEDAKMSRGGDIVDSVRKAHKLGMALRGKRIAMDGEEKQRCLEAYMKAPMKALDLIEGMPRCREIVEKVETNPLQENAENRKTTATKPTSKEVLQAKKVAEAISQVRDGDYNAKDIVNEFHEKASAKINDINKNPNTVKTVPQQQYEYVNHPRHYNNYDVEVIDMMERIFGINATINFCKLNAFKYRMRAGTKPEVTIEQDLEKEDWYLRKAEELEASLF